MRSIKYLSSYLMINCKHIKQAVMKVSVAIEKLGIVSNILWLLQKLWTWSRGMNFVAKLWWVWTLIPQYLAKTTFLVAMMSRFMMSKFISCWFISFFYNFVERVMRLKLNKTKERIFFMVWQWYLLHHHNLAF